MKAWYVLLIVPVIFSMPVHAQPFNVDLNFAAGSPKGSFGNEIDRISYGVDGSFSYKFSGIPFHLGIGANYQNYGWRERETAFNPDVPEVTVRVRTTNNMLTPYLLFRIEPEGRKISPFAEGIFGFNYLYTESSVLDDFDDEEIARSTNYDDITLSYGIGGGLRFKVYEGLSDQGDLFSVALIARGRYNVGGEATYLKEGGLTRNNGNLEYDFSRSRTDLVTIHFGFAFSF